MTTDKEYGFFSILVMVIAVVFIVVVTLVYKDCQNMDDHREKCVTETHDPKGCSELFHTHK